MLPKQISGLKRERGQSFMELAISLLFLLVLLSAVIDLGWAFYTMVALRDTAQEAASFAAMCPETSNRNRVMSRLRDSATAPLNVNDIDAGDIEICIVGPNPATHPPVFGCASEPAAVRGNNVRVSVRIQHQILTPFVGTFIGTQSYPLMVTVSNTILVDRCATNN